MAVAHARLRYDKINVVVTPPEFQAIKNFSVKADSVIRLEITLTARQLDGAHRAAFKRTGLFLEMVLDLCKCKELLGFLTKLLNLPHP